MNDDVWNKIISEYGGFCKGCRKFNVCTSKCIFCDQFSCTQGWVWLMDNSIVCRACRYERLSGVYVLYNGRPVIKGNN